MLFVPLIFALLCVVLYVLCSLLSARYELDKRCNQQSTFGSLIVSLTRAFGCSPLTNVYRTLHSRIPPPSAFHSPFSSDTPLFILTSTYVSVVWFGLPSNPK
jgi:hypothetical protein